MLPLAGHAHHGMAALGAVGLEGPGGPLETTVAANLPQGDWLGYMKLDYAKFETFTPARDDETDFNAYWLYGLGYGFTSYLTGYVFLPFTSKAVEDNSFNTTGFGDAVFTATLGFKYDDGWQLVPESEGLDDWYDWHFSLYAGLTLPTGDADIRDAGGNIDPGQSLGFGEPAYLVGLGATRLVTDDATVNLDISYFGFQENGYADGSNFRFGDEFRINAAWVQKLTTDAEARTRWDAILEANYLDLGRDELEGVGEIATGGKMIYAQPAVRYYVDNLSFGLGVKVPVWTDLNEEDAQQGAEGKEDYRLIFTASMLF
jgi:hypothetical protein